MSTPVTETIGAAKGALGTAAGGAVHAASSAKTSFMDVAKLALGAASTLRALGLGPFGWVGLARSGLRLVGLSRRRSPLGTLALVGAGVAMGAGVALLIAPRSGEKTRRMIARRFNGMKREAVELEHEVEQKVADVAGAVKSTVEGAAEQVRDAVTPEPGTPAKRSGSADAGRGEAQKFTGAQAEARRGHSFS
jgi:hypothetical protein